MAAVALVATGGLLGTPAVASAAPAGGGPLVALAPAAPGAAALAAPPVANLSEGLRTTSATVKKTNCAALTRKAKRTKGAQRKWLQQQAKRCPAGNKRLTQALKAIGDGHYVGTRGDGQQVDWTICANGKYSLRSTGSYGTAVSTGTKWQIVWTAANGSNGFKAILEDRASDGGGLSVGLSLSGGKWGVGIASFGSEVNKIGPVERTDAKAACAAL